MASEYTLPAVEGWKRSADRHRVMWRGPYGSGESHDTSYNRVFVALDEDGEVEVDIAVEEDTAKDPSQTALIPIAVLADLVHAWEARK